MKLWIKIDVDTDRGTAEGVPALCKLLEKLQIPSTFLFSLGPDHTGRAISRIFRPGFFKKVTRTNVVENYGLKTLLYGTLLPAPQIGKRHVSVLRTCQTAGFDLGIHSYDHYLWQDHLLKLTRQRIFDLVSKAQNIFSDIFKVPATIAGAAGWIINEDALDAYQATGVTLASDTRGTIPFYPTFGPRTHSLLQVPTTLPTLDELLSQPDIHPRDISSLWLKTLKEGLNVLTIHAEMEGGAYLPLFQRFLEDVQVRGVQFLSAQQVREFCIRQNWPSAPLYFTSLPGRPTPIACSRETAQHSTFSKES